MTTLFAADPPVLRDAIEAGEWIAAGVILVLGIAAGFALRALLARSLRRGDSERHTAEDLTRGVG